MFSRHMLMGKTEKHQDPTMNPSSVYYLHPTDTSLKLVANIFKGVGFKGWKRAMSIALSGKNKIGFVNGTVTKSVTSSSQARAWDRVNDTVIGWIINVVDENIAKSILWLKTAKEVWDELEHRYGQSSSAQLFHIEEELSKVSQTNDMSIEEFNTKLKGIWDELDALNPVVSCTCKGCNCNLSQKANNSQQSRRLVQFLMKLHYRYHQTRSNILMMKPTPTAAEAYGILLQEQVHHEIIKNVFNEEQETMVCRVEKRKFYESKNKNYTGNKKPNNGFFCEHCKIPVHTQDKCWKLHGYPPKLKNNSWRKDNKIASNVSNTEYIHSENKPAANESKLTDEQIGQLLSLLNKQDPQNEVKEPSVSSTAHLAGKTCFNVQKKPSGS